MSHLSGAWPAHLLHLLLLVSTLPLPYRHCLLSLILRCCVLAVGPAPADGHLELVLDHLVILLSDVKPGLLEGGHVWKLFGLLLWVVHLIYIAVALPPLVLHSLHRSQWLHRLLALFCQRRSLSLLITRLILLFLSRYLHFLAQTKYLWHWWLLNHSHFWRQFGLGIVSRMASFMRWLLMQLALPGPTLRLAEWNDERLIDWGLCCLIVATCNRSIGCSNLLALDWSISHCSSLGCFQVFVRGFEISCHSTELGGR